MANTLLIRIRITCPPPRRRVLIQSSQAIVNNIIVMGQHEFIAFTVAKLYRLNHTAPLCWLVKYQRCGRAVGNAESRSWPENRLAQPGTEPCREDQPGHSRPRVRLDDSLIPSLIHPRPSASIGVYRRSLSRQGDHRGPPCTVIRNPERRKVSSSPSSPARAQWLRQCSASASARYFSSSVGV
jgi:hypothetical protein